MLSKYAVIPFCNTYYSVQFLLMILWMVKFIASKSGINDLKIYYLDFFKKNQNKTMYRWNNFYNIFQSNSPGTLTIFFFVQPGFQLFSLSLLVYFRFLYNIHDLCFGFCLCCLKDSVLIFFMFFFAFKISFIRTVSSQIYFRKQPHAKNLSFLL